MDAEQLDGDADRAFEIRASGLDVAGDTDPRWILAPRHEDADAQILRQIRPHLQRPVGDAVQSQEHRTAGRIAPARERAALEDVDEQPPKGLDRIVVAPARRDRRGAAETSGDPESRESSTRKSLRICSPLVAARLIGRFYPQLAEGGPEGRFVDDRF